MTSEEDSAPVPAPVFNPKLSGPGTDSEDRMRSSRALYAGVQLNDPMPSAEMFAASDADDE